MNPKKYVKYTNHWVAIDDETNEIVSASKRLKELKKKIDEKKLSKIVIHYLTAPNKSLAPYALN